MIGYGLSVNGALIGIPESWMVYLNVFTGGLILNNGANIYGYVTTPDGVVAIYGRTFIVGGVAANQLLIKNNGKLCLGQSCN